MKTDFLIVGGGLSGLYLASKLQEQGQNFQLIEARDRFGGRILSQELGGAVFDLGPAWFWHGQPRIADLIERLGLKVFEQFSHGDLMFEDERGVQRGRGYASMQGSLRLEGGLGKLVDALNKKIEQNRKQLGNAITTLEDKGDYVCARLSKGTTISANTVILALPPRIAKQKIMFSPSLPEQAHFAMSTIPTWMAGQAKAVAVFETPFWRSNGLSGDAMSRIGPLVEIHDASPADGGPYALFGFIGVAPERRTDEELLKDQICAQLARLFGKQASQPIGLLIKDWASDQMTATKADLQPLLSHPRYELPAALQGLWKDKLLFAGTEVAPQFGGYLEGALESADNLLACSPLRF